MSTKLTPTIYRVEVLHDSDWGLHQADDGYSIRVTPMADGITLLGGVYVQDVTTREAGKRLGFTDFVNAGELYELCEDGDETALAVSEMADNVVRPEMFERVRVELTPAQIAEIDKKYHDREGDFNTFVEGWILK